MEEEVFTDIEKGGDLYGVVRPVDVCVCVLPDDRPGYFNLLVRSAEQVIYP